MLESDRLLLLLFSKTMRFRTVAGHSLGGALGTMRGNDSGKVAKPKGVDEAWSELSMDSNVDCVVSNEAPCADKEILGGRGCFGVSSSGALAAAKRKAGGVGLRKGDLRCLDAETPFFDETDRPGGRKESLTGVEWSLRLFLEADGGSSGKCRDRS